MNKATSQNFLHAFRKTTLIFLLQQEKVLLGEKKSGFGKGYWLGIGGKVEASETIEQAAVRELQEEINVKTLYLKKVGTLDFYFPSVADGSWNQQTHVFTCTKWLGEPSESAEIRPQWVPKNEVPFEKMWNDAKYWLPLILRGEIIKMEFIFKDKAVVSSYKSFSDRKRIVRNR